MSGPIRGIDASLFQNVIDWAAVKESGLVQFAYARATDGASFCDPEFSRNHDTARERNLPFGAYHFWRFDDDPAAQARNFLARTHDAGRFGTLLPMADVEEESFQYVVPPVLDAIARLARFIFIVEGALRAPASTAEPKMLLYTNYDTWQRFFTNTAAFRTQPLWLAQTENPADGLYGGWTTYAIWQDGTTTVPGIAGPVDYDTLAPGMDLQRLAR